MTPVSFQLFLTDLLAEESIVYFNPPAVYPAADQSKIISWPNQQTVLANRQVVENTIDEYVSDLRENNYTCLLPNGSILQIEYKWKASAIWHHRYCYLPAPFDLGGEVVRPDDIEGLTDLASGLSAGDVRLKTKLRFEYDAEENQINHPKSHLHIHYPACRIPVKSSIGVHSFFRFVFRHFCNDRFTESHILSRRRGDGGGDLLTPEESKEAHVFWRV